MISERWQDTALYNKILATTAAIATIFGLLNLGVLAYQTRILQQSSAESTMQTERLLKHAEKVAAAMEITVRQSKEAATAVLASTHSDQRAWVTIKEVTLRQPLVVGQVPLIHVEFANSGKSPACEVSTTCASYVNAYPLDRNELDSLIAQNENKNPGSRAILGAGAFLENGGGGKNFTWVPGLRDGGGPVLKPAVNGGQFVLSQVQWDSMRQKGQTFFLEGLVSYKDVFGDSHFTRFRYQLIKNAAGIEEFNVASAGNDAN